MNPDEPWWSQWWTNTIFTEPLDGDGIVYNTWLTLYMTFGTMLFTVLLGVPLGMLLYSWSRSTSQRTRNAYKVLGFLVNVLRSFPFIILILAVMPVTELITGRITGATSALVPLVISAVPFFARLVEVNLREVAQGKIEAAQMMGASRSQVMRQVLLAEALPGILGSFTTTTIVLVGYTAMMGTTAAGGLGDLAIRRGYNGNDTVVIWATVLILLVMVIAVQMIGDRLVKRVDHRAQA